MTATCARCGDDAERELTPPPNWVLDLREERDFDPPGDSVRFPLCAQCYSRGVRLKESNMAMDTYPDDVQESVLKDMATFLDDLDLGRIEVVDDEE